jgi:hypothetical protein
MIATYFCDFEDNYGTFAILGWINLQMVIIAVVVSIISRAMSWRESSSHSSIYLHHIGGHLLWQFQVVVGSWKLLTRSKGGQRMNLWATRPWAASKPSVCCGMELLFAAAVFGLVLWQMIKTNSTEKLAILIFMGLVLTFPFYVLISSYKED